MVILRIASSVKRGLRLLRHRSLPPKPFLPNQGDSSGRSRDDLQTYIIGLPYLATASRSSTGLPTYQGFFSDPSQLPQKLADGDARLTCTSISLTVEVISLPRSSPLPHAIVPESVKPPQDCQRKQSAWVAVESRIGAGCWDILKLTKEIPSSSCFSNGSVAYGAQYHEICTCCEGMMDYAAQGYALSHDCALPGPVECSEAWLDPPLSEYTSFRPAHPAILNILAAFQHWSWSSPSRNRQSGPGKSTRGINVSRIKYKRTQIPLRLHRMTAFYFSVLRVERLIAHHQHHWSGIQMRDSRHLRRIER